MIIMAAAGLTARTLFGHMPRHSTPVWVHCVATAGCQPAPRLPVTAPWFGCIMIIMAAAGRQPASCLAVTAARFGRVMIIVATAGCQPAACLATCLVTAPRSGCINDHYGRCGLTASTLFGHMPRPRHSTPVWVHCAATAGCQPAPRLPVTAPWFGCIMIIMAAVGRQPASCLAVTAARFGRVMIIVTTAGCQPAACLATFLVTAPRSGCINDHYGRCGLTARTLFGHMPRHSTPVWVHCVATAGCQPAPRLPVTAPWFGCIMIIMAAAGRQPASCLAVTAARFGRVMIIVATAGCQPAACLATFLVTAPRSGCIMIIMAAAGRQPASCLAVTAARFGRVMIIVATAGCQPAACLATFLVTAPRSGCINDHYGRCGLTARTLFGHMPRHSTPVWVHCVATAGCQPAPRLPVTAPWFGCIMIIMAAAGRQPASCLAVAAARFGRVMIIVATAGCQH